MQSAQSKSQSHWLLLGDACSGENTINTHLVQTLGLDQIAGSAETDVVSAVLLFLFPRLAYMRLFSFLLRRFLFHSSQSQSQPIARTLHRTLCDDLSTDTLSAILCRLIYSLSSSSSQSVQNV